MGSRNIHPDSSATSTAVHLRPDKGFNSPQLYLLEATADNRRVQSPHLHKSAGHETRIVRMWRSQSLIKSGDKEMLG